MGCTASKQTVPVEAFESDELPDPSPYLSIEHFYELGKRIGKGQYGYVFEAHHKKTRTRVAVKKIDRARSRKEYITAEISVLRLCQESPHIVNLLDVFETEKHVFLVLEMMEGGEMFDLLVNQGAYSEQEAMPVVFSVMKAVHFMHARGVVHRDLKPENLLLTGASARAQVKLGDFGLSRFLREGNVLRSICGTWAYSAPEMRVKGRPGYDFKIDIWSVGIIMFIILSGYHPFDPQGTAEPKQVMEATKRGHFEFDDEAWTNVSASAKSLIRAMIEVNPRKRLSAKAALQHPWLRRAGEVHLALQSDPQPESDLVLYKRELRRKLKASFLAAYASIAMTSIASNMTSRRSFMSIASRMESEAEDLPGSPFVGRRSSSNVNQFDSPRSVHSRTRWSVASASQVGGAGRMSPRVTMSHSQRSIDTNVAGNGTPRSQPSPKSRRRMWLRDHGIDPSSTSSGGAAPPRGRNSSASMGDVLAGSMSRRQRRRAASASGDVFGVPGHPEMMRSRSFMVRRPHGSTHSTPRRRHVTGASASGGAAASSAPGSPMQAAGGRSRHSRSHSLHLQVEAAQSTAAAFRDREGLYVRKSSGSTSSARSSAEVSPNSYVLHAERRSPLGSQPVISAFDAALAASAGAVVTGGTTPTSITSSHLGSPGGTPHSARYGMSGPSPSASAYRSYHRGSTASSVVSGIVDIHHELVGGTGVGVAGSSGGGHHGGGGGSGSSVRQSASNSSGSLVPGSANNDSDSDADGGPLERRHSRNSSVCSTSSRRSSRRVSSFSSSQRRESAFDLIRRQRSRRVSDSLHANHSPRLGPGAGPGAGMAVGSGSLGGTSSSVDVPPAIGRRASHRRVMALAAEASMT